MAKFERPAKQVEATIATEEEVISDGAGHVLAIIHAGDWRVLDDEDVPYPVRDSIFRCMYTPLDADARALMDENRGKS